MRIKSKLIWAIGSLFTMILVLAVLATVYMHKLGSDTRNILVANYQTVHYMQQMESFLGQSYQQSLPFRSIDSLLQLQQQNVTEPGERELTEALAAGIRELKTSSQQREVVLRVHRILSQISGLNMDAILRKYELARQTHETGIFWISLIGTCCVLIALTLWFNVPGYIANPIRQLTESIQAIARENYTQRLHLEAGGEFSVLSKSFNVMAEKLEAYQQSNLQKLLVEKQRVETLINTMPDPVWGIDEHHRFLFVNNGAVNVTGLPREDLVGQQVNTVAERNDLVRLVVQPLLQSGRPTVGRGEMVKIVVDQREHYFEREVLPIEIVPVGETTPRDMGIVIFLHDVTEHKALDVAKTNFLATVSHEFKTPIASIQMSLNLLENAQVGQLNQDQASLLHSIHEDTDRLLRITSELLDMTQVESGQIHLQLEPIQADLLALECLDAVRQQAQAGRIQLVFETGEQQYWMQADTRKAGWVLANLLQNAIRYSPENSVVKLKLLEQGNFVLFQVEDQGRGIPAEYLDRIFDRYFRVPGTVREGTGLGLAICKQLVEAQHGNLSVTSTVGQGSTFQIAWPRWEDNR